MEYRVRDLTAPPGKKTSGWLKVFDSWNGPFSLPLIIINGAQEGKRLFVQALQHGDEYAGLAAVHRIADLVDPAELTGTLVMIPCMNVPAYVAGLRWGPLDGLNMNRVWPGSSNGMFSQQVVRLVADEILPHVDYAIDLHGGTNELEILSYVLWGDAPDESALPLAMAAGIELLTGDGKHDRNYFQGLAPSMGIPTLVIEAGGGAHLDEQGVRDHVKAVTNVMKHLKMLPGQPEGLPSRYKFLENTEGFTRSHTGGLLHSSVALGDWAKAGQTLGIIVNLLGDLVEEVKAPYDCLVREVRTMPRVEPGGWLYLLDRVTREVSAGMVQGVTDSSGE